MKRDLYSKIEDGTWDDAQKIVYCPSKIISEKIRELVETVGYSSYKNLFENSIDCLHRERVKDYVKVQRDRFEYKKENANMPAEEKVRKELEVKELKKKVIQDKENEKYSLICDRVKGNLIDNGDGTYDCQYITYGRFPDQETYKQVPLLSLSEQNVRNQFASSRDKIAERMGVNPEDLAQDNYEN